MLSTLFGSESGSDRFSEARFGELNLAADVGKVKGSEACGKYFGKCDFKFKFLLETFRENVKQQLFN